MASVEDQNPAKRRPVWTGEVVGSDEGLTRVSVSRLERGRGVAGGRPRRRCGSAAASLTCSGDWAEL
jgi:hypothetical protein